MKKNFTFLLTALFLCMGMTMKAEVAVESPWVGSAIENGQTYYLYNVKAKAFLKGANSWGTQASFGEDAMAFTVAGEGNSYVLKSTAHVQWWASVACLGSDLYVDSGAEQQFGFNLVADGVYTFTLNDAYVAYTGNSVVQTVAEVNDGCYWQLLTAESIKQQMAEKAGAATPYAVTPLIPGANFGRADYATDTWSGGLTLGGDNANHCAEKFNTEKFEVSQTLTGLPAGTYKLQAQGFYRMGSIDAAAAARANGTENYDVKFFANDQSITVMSVMAEAGKMDIGADYGNYGKAPNNMGEASNFFTNGYYEHEFYFTVTADGNAKVGITKNSHVADDWVIFDNFRLTYYGTATVEEIEQAKLGEFFTAVEELIAAAKAVETTYSAEAKAELDAAVAAGEAAIEALTKEALVAAAAPLEAAIARAERSVALNALDLTSATLESPIDMTQFVANPDMETGDIKGWTTTAGWQFQNNNQFANGDAVINNKFQERWVWAAGLGNTSTEQTLLDMPNGVYSVSASIIATRQDDANPKEAATGVYLFAGDEKVAVATENETPELFTVQVVVENNALTFGIKGEDAQANWIAFDNVKLVYLGAPVVEPEYLTIVSAMAGDVEIVEGAATVESISSFEITFNRPVALVEYEDPIWAQLADQWGDNSLKAEVLEENNCVVCFSLQWGLEFTDAGDYYLYIPEGIVADAEDANCINAAIEAVITIEGGSATASTLNVTSVTVGEDEMADFIVVATPDDMIKVNFDGKFYFQGSPVIVDAEGNDAPMAFEYMNGLDLDGSNSYFLMGKTAGIYTIILPKAQFNELEMMGWKAPAEDIVLTVEIMDGETNIKVVDAEVESVIYDLSGRRVEKAVKGIYIVNGKKVVIK